MNQGTFETQRPQNFRVKQNEASGTCLSLLGVPRHRVNKDAIYVYIYIY